MVDCKQMSLESISIMDVLNKDVKTAEQKQNIFELSPRFTLSSPATI